MGKATVRKNGKLNKGNFIRYTKSNNNAHKVAKNLLTTVDTDEPVIPKRQLRTKKCVVCHTDEVLKDMNVCSNCYNINLNDDDE